jgi:hypothetical protein
MVYDMQITIVMKCGLLKKTYITGGAHMIRANMMGLSLDSWDCP